MAIEGPAIQEIDRNVLNNPNNNNRNNRYVNAEERFRQELQTRRNLDIVRIQGDGNCFFRSIAHQVYGDEAHHRVIRNKIVDYIVAQQEFFSNYISDMSFSRYCQQMRTLGTWGGNIEIQAASEMYQRPIEVYAYSS